MSDRRRRAGRLAAAALPLLIPCAGCTGPGSRAEFVSHKDPYFPERFAATFDECVYRQNGEGDYQIVALARGGGDGPGAPAVRQLLELHVYWKPVPGRTPADATAIDALVRYVVQTPRSTSVYQGGGFVFLRTRPFDGSLAATLESGRLRPDRHVGDGPETIGDVDATATLLARRDFNRTVDLAREIELAARQPPSD